MLVQTRHSPSQLKHYAIPSSLGGQQRSFAVVKMHAEPVARAFTRVSESYLTEFLNRHEETTLEQSLPAPKLNTVPIQTSFLTYHLLFTRNCLLTWAQMDRHTVFLKQL